MRYRLRKLGRPLIKLQTSQVRTPYKSPYFWLILLCSIAIYSLYYSTPNILLDKLLPGWHYLILFEFNNHMNGLLLIIPLGVTLYVFRWPAVLIFWSASIVILFPYLMGMNSSIIFLVVNLLFAALPILLISFTVIPSSFWMPLSPSTSRGVTMLSENPLCPARPVRPLRWV